MGEVTQNAASLSPKVQQVLELVSGMTLLESAELVKAFEQKFGVSAAPVAAAAAVAAPAAGAAAAAETPKASSIFLTRSEASSSVKPLISSRIDSTLLAISFPTLPCEIKTFLLLL